MVTKEDFIYLASPYSSQDSIVMIKRYEAVAFASSLLMKDGFVVYSPIAHCHPIAERYGLPRDYEYWKAFDTMIVQKCTALLVLLIAGWLESFGVQDEIRIAEEAGIPVYGLICEAVGYRIVPLEEMRMDLAARLESE